MQRNDNVMDTQTDFYRKQFYQETREILEQVSRDLLQAEADPGNHELLNAIFRGIHTIKGSTGVFGLDELAEFTHHLEGVLNALRNGKIELVPELADAVLAGADHIGKMIYAYESGQAVPSDNALSERFKSFYAEISYQQPEAQPEPVISLRTDPEYDSLSQEVRRALETEKLHGLQIFKISLHYTSELLENGYDPLIFLKNLRKASAVYHVLTPDLFSVPQIDQFEPFALYLNPVIYIATPLSAEEIRNLTFDPSLIEITEINTDNIPEPEYKDPASLKEFITDASEIIESLEKAVLEYEADGSAESLNQLFRGVHTIKGDSDFIGLRAMTVFAHSFESLLENLRAGKTKRNSEITDIILKSVDYIVKSISELEKEGKMPPMPEVFETLKSRTAPKSGHSIPGLLHLLPADLREAFEEQVAQYEFILSDYSKPLPLDEKRKKIIGRALRGLSHVSEFAGLDNLREYAQEIMAASEAGEDQELCEFIDGLSDFIDQSEAQSVPEKEEKSEFSVIKPADDIFREVSVLKKESYAGHEIRTMRIDEQKVEQFTNMVNELLIAKNTYSHLLSLIKDDAGENRQILKAMKENLRLFSRLSDDMHHGVMSLRMIPVKGIFQKFTRLVRDISRRQGKLIELITEGENIDIDKKIADMLSEPLVHLVRNACDHGIESPENRRASGKSEKGRITLSASQEGSSIHIRVIDDGKGIDRKKLIAKAAEAGIKTDEKDDTAVLNLIFMPGISTALAVSDISGRGVGMDVVRTAVVQSLSGSVSAASEPGKCTEITLSIPTSLGIDSVLFVEAGKASYAIPLEYIVETMKFSAEKIRRAGKHKFFYYRGDVIHTERLENILSDRTSHIADVSKDEEISMVIVKTALGRYGLIIDRLGINTDVAIRPLPKVLSGNPMIGGVSIMGDGKAFLVLNPDKFF